MAHNTSDLGSWIIEPPWRRSIYLDQRSINARRILSDLPAVTFVDHPERADLVWVRKGFMSLLPHLKTHQLLNHFADESAMINKARLTGYLGALSPASRADFYPERTASSASM